MAERDLIEAVPACADAIASIARLPNRALQAGQLLQDRFREQGIVSFHEACVWVYRLPYAPAAPGDAVTALFAGQCGTCTTKHGAIAALAFEMGLDVHKHLGFYRLDEEMVPGVAALLRPLSLPFVPMTHCVLRSGDVQVDLTAGNADGRARPIDSYDFTVAVTPESTSEDFERLYVEHLPRYYSIESRLSGVPLETIVALANQCRQLKREVVLRSCQPVQPL